MSETEWNTRRNLAALYRAETRFATPEAGQRTWDSLVRMLERDGVTDYLQ